MSDALAVIASLAVLLGFVTALIGLVNARQARQAAKLAAEAAALAQATAGKVQDISVQVDGRLSTLLERQAQLLGTLHEAGVEVPPKPGE